MPDRHADVLEELFQVLDRSEHVGEEALEALRVALLDVPHPGWEHYRQAGAVGHVVVRGDLVLDAVGRPITMTGGGVEHAVVGDGGGPHEVRPAVIVLRLLEDAVRVPLDDAQHALAQLVGDVGVVVVDEVALEDVRHHVDDAARGLVVRQGVGQLRVEDGEDRPETLRAGALLLARVLVGDDGVRAALAPRGRDGEDGADRKGVRRLRAGVEIPDVAVILDAHRDGLGGVDDATAADGEDETDALLPAELYALLDEAEARVGLDAGELGDGDARVLQGFPDRIVEAGPLDAALTVMEEDVGGMLLHLFADALFLALAEDVSRVQLQFEVSHGKQEEKAGPYKSLEVAHR